MKMKMRMIAFGLTALVCAGLLIVPMVVRHSIPSVAACFPQRMVEPQRVLCSGVIEDKSGMRIYCETPVMVKELFVEPGQRVEKGTPIACVAAVRYTEGLDEAVQQYSDLLPQDVLSVLASSDMTAGYSVSEKTETIYAQCDGFISTVYAEAGAVASVDTPIAGISQMRRVYMRASVTEQEIARIREGQPAIVTGIGFSGKEYAAQVSEISPMTRAVSLGATTRTTWMCCWNLKRLMNHLNRVFPPKRALRWERMKFLSPCLIVRCCRRTTAENMFTAFGKAEHKSAISPREGSMHRRWRSRVGFARRISLPWMQPGLRAKECWCGRRRHKSDAGCLPSFAF
ncbi:MAG: efflux RND transporter periplasmic adaptor subunit [Clostridia bacterium]|nr:efflux RND transporter periplasmic adaptor subunit [Clostridia bacterium]